MIEVLQLDKYTSPDIEENKRNGYVEYGEDNNYFQYLIDRYKNSTTNNAIINGLVLMMFGKGLKAKTASNKADQWAQVKSLISDECMRKLFLDKKILGMAAIQVTKNKGKITNLTHYPMHTLRPEIKDKNGDIKNWYYHPNWSEKKNSEKPEKFKAYSQESKKGNEIFIWGKYSPGNEYFTPPDYEGALPYAVLEQEISQYLINNVKNRFSSTKVVNVYGNIPDDNQRRLYTEQIKQRLTGSEGDMVIVNFSENEEGKTEVEDIPLDNAPNLYEYLSKECFEKLIAGHRITSPMLLGIRAGSNGLGNNADEIETATNLLLQTNVAQYQQELASIIEQLVSVNGIALELYFENVGSKDIAPETEDKAINLANEMYESKIADDLIANGEDELQGYELIDDSEVDYEREEEMDAKVLEAEEALREKSFLEKIGLAQTGTARPNANSQQDKTVDGFNYKVRYKYNPERTSANSREFCKKMVSAGKMYRKEDIIRMGGIPVNAGFGEGGSSTYSIWKYKGGARCHHKWRRLTFRKQGSIDVKSPLAPKVSTNQAEREGYRIRNPREVAMKPKDMARKGFSPNNRNLPKDAR